LLDENADDDSINNRNQIVGYSTKTDQKHAVLWTLRSG
jgi:hypothetical protein